MKYYTLFLIFTSIFILFEQNICAQQFQSPQIWLPRHSSTAAEGFLRGSAALWVGKGHFLRNLGEYEILHQNAHAQYIENRLHRIQAYWAIKDEYAARAKRDYLSPLEKEKRILDLAEERHKLKLRRLELIEKGVLPKPQEPSMTFNGKTYKSYSDFFATEDWFNMREQLAERQRAQLQQEMENEARFKNSIKFKSWYDNLSPSQKLTYKGKLYEKFHKFNQPLSDDSSVKRFYEIRPYLEPRAGKGDLPKWPW